MFTIEIGFVDNGTRKHLDKQYADQGTAENVAFWLLGGDTPRGTIATSLVLNDKGEIVSEFEF